VEGFLRGYARVIEEYRAAPGSLSTGEAVGMFGFPPGPGPGPAAPAEPAAEKPIGAGTRRDAGPRTPESEAESALADAIARAHPEAAVLDFAHAYAEAGGLTLRMPQVVANLERLGWTGVGMEELDGLVPLHRLARRLTPAVARQAAPAVL
jgi:hypothetical protein